MSAKPKKKKIIIFAVILAAIIAIAGGVVATLLVIKSASASKTQADEGENAAEFQSNYDYIVGAWESQNSGSSCYIFGKGGIAYWQQKCGNYDDNYYYGEISQSSGVLRGEKALKSISKNLEDLKELFQLRDDIKADDVYYILISIYTKKIGGERVALDASTREKYQLIFIRPGTSNKAYGCLLNTGDIYEFKLNAEIRVPFRPEVTPAGTPE